MPMNRYRLISLHYYNCADCGFGARPTQSSVLGEFAERAELDEEILKRSWKGYHFAVDFLIDGIWYRGSTNSQDPIAWIK